MMKKTRNLKRGKGKIWPGEIFLIVKLFTLLFIFGLLSLPVYSASGNNNKEGNSSTFEKLDIKLQNPVRGTVTDAYGNSLPGVNIVEKETGQGTITDLNGNYTINISGSNATLVFSFIGYLTEEMAVTANTTVDLVLVEDIRQLDEVVVVGYGTVRRSDITGSLSSVTSDQIDEMPVQDLSQAIQGRAAGVDVVRNNFRPGEAATIRVRGNRSILASNDPLYVIDGIPTTFGIGEINPQDIQSIEILKDASATAIYGSRAANGVILVTTKRAKADVMSVNYSATVSWDQPLREIDMMDGGQWAEMRREANRTVGAYNSPHPEPGLDQALFFDAMGSDPYTWESIRMGYEWEDEENLVVARDEEGVPIYNPSNVRTYPWVDNHGTRTGLVHNHQLSMSGGTDKLAALFSIGYLNQEGVIETQQYERLNARLNLDLQLLDWFKVGANTAYTVALQDYGTDMYGKTNRQLPIAGPYDSEGEFVRFPGRDPLILNPVMDPDLVIDERRLNRYFGSYYAEIEFFEGFRYRINAGGDYRHRRLGIFQDALSSDRDAGVNFARYDQFQDFSWTVENLLFYDKSFGDHNFGITLLQSAGATRFEFSDIRVIDVPYSSQLWYNVGTTVGNDGNPQFFNSGYNRTQIMSYMGRVNYGYDNRYLVTATIRRDATSVFHPDNNSDYFPSFAFAWNAHNEAFLQNIDPISQLKLRIGYGTTGQQAVRPYDTEGRIEQSIYNWGGGTTARGFISQFPATRAVGWEKTASLNAGLDFGLFRNRIHGNIDVYYNNTFDLLMNRSVPAVNGYDAIRANIGKVSNKGIDITINSVNISRAQGFSWETSLVFSRNIEEIVELYGDAQDDRGNRWFIGHPTIVYFHYEKEGIWQIEDAEEMAMFNDNGHNYVPGQIKVVDQNGDYRIDEEDFTILGTPNPDWTAGITNRLAYKGIELSFFVYFRQGGSIFNRALSPMLAGRYQDRNVDYWTQDNPTNEYPRPDRFRDFPQHQQALYLADASFIKVRHITLGYDIPARLVNRIGVKNLNIYVQALNPFIFTDYPLLDPEAFGLFNQNDLLGSGPRDALSPLEGMSTKSWVFGIKLGL